MRTAATTNVVKLYGKIDEDLKSDNTYIINVSSGNKPSTDYSDFDGEKWLILANANNLGGRNFMLGSILLACCIISLAWIVFFLIYNKKVVYPTIHDVFK